MMASALQAEGHGFEPHILQSSHTFCMPRPQSFAFLPVPYHHRGFKPQRPTLQAEGHGSEPHILQAFILFACRGRGRGFRRRPKDWDFAVLVDFVAFICSNLID
jgi:hypothetical protein